MKVMNEHEKVFQLLKVQGEEGRRYLYVKPVSPDLLFLQNRVKPIFKRNGINTPKEFMIVVSTETIIEHPPC